MVVRHAELGVAIPETLRTCAIDWLEHEEIDWDEETKRRLRREKEIALLRRARARRRLASSRDQSDRVILGQENQPWRNDEPSRSTAWTR